MSKEEKEKFKQMQLKIMCLPGEPVYARLIFRKLSRLLIPFISRSAVTPNKLTLCSIIAGALGAVFLMLPGFFCYLAGGFFIIAWYFLDVLDGDLARFKHMESLKGVYLDALGHYLVNPLIFASSCVFLALELREFYYLGLGFIAFLGHQYSRLAKDICHSVRYVQIDHNANPRQTIEKAALIPKSPGRPEKTVSIISILSIPASYIFDALSITLIAGILRVLAAFRLYNLSLAIYVFLIFLALLGTSLIVKSEIKKLS